MTIPFPATLSPLPRIIQGGMGIGVSDWRLAHAVSRLGHLGVVSGTALDTLFVRRLQDGDPGGHMRRGLAAFPWRRTAEAILERHFIPGGRAPGDPYRLLPMWRRRVSPERERIAVVAAFVEVWLAREGHDGPVGMNLLTKVQLPNPATLYGAILAGVDAVLMGAGIPRDIPGLLDDLAEHRPTSMRLDLEGVRGDEVRVHFDPAVHWAAEGVTPGGTTDGGAEGVTPEGTTDGGAEGAGLAEGGAEVGGLPEGGAEVGALPDGRAEGGGLPAVARPLFLPIVASNSLARMLARKANGRVDGFVVEGPTAGGHNAPPRGALETNARGEPVYGERDEVDLEELAALGLPFWLAGGEGSPEGLARALAAGAEGIQVGTLFAYAEESGLAPELRAQVLEQVRSGGVELYTDLKASPTGFPFKVVQLEGTGSSGEVYEERERICDLGYLRTPVRRDDGRIDYRCPAEPVDAWAKKGGRAEETEGRRCLCNALMADVGVAQERAAGAEPALVTSGDELLRLGRFLEGRTSYRAADVVAYLTGDAAG